MPKIGVYDKYAINLGYRPNPDKTAEDEKPVLDAWILEHAGDILYGQVVGQFNRYMGHFSNNIGWFHNINGTREAGKPYFEDDFNFFHPWTTEEKV